MSRPDGFIQPYAPVAQDPYTPPPPSALHSQHHHSQSEQHHQQSPYQENQRDDAFFLYKEAKGEIIMNNNNLDGGVPPLFTKWQRVYMIIATAEAVIIFGLSSTIFGLVNVEETDTRTRTLPVYLSIFLLAQIFALLYVFDALRARNVVQAIQLILHLCLNFMLFLYAILQIPQTRIALRDAHEDNAECGHFENCIGPHSLWNVVLPLLIIPVIIFTFAIIAFGTLVRRLADEFGWDVYRYTGASTEIKHMLRAYQTLVSLLKLMLFFATAFCIAYLILITAWDSKKAEFIVTVIALPLLFILVLACGWALREENKFVMSAILVLMVAGMAYFIYKLSTLWLPRTSSLYINTRITMAILSIFAILILFVTFIYGIICMSNFGKGLRGVHDNPRNKISVLSCLPSGKGGWDGEGELREDGEGQAGYGHGYGQGGRRFEIA
ncbi:hypothetical protein L198_04818 [Cryptococcus wingfieldii CBS 7118]|uniref:Uncharacterized protein n=1 Tax=Cryptococcus wingfieldii CBS 7118 TaxID=1295528 RepID=A0A1E3J1D0_9TREE|nr:hypothetical protein L198_04818 [Cryptococcus wingfieldii CBS 7118]ODN94677.1 hypothetical protein L198_04818 [Cryptococcus wingfieldii CBS 7118]